MSSQTPSARPIVTVELEAHLSEQGLKATLATAEASIRKYAEPVGLLVDCRKMESYDAAARAHFVEWNSGMRKRIARLAVVTERQLWHMVVSGMALASRQTMKPFSEIVPARDWLER
ncbi:MAG TPA: STAS/SEC14 domain-containing protein [Polyangiaceae bacterium]